MVAVASRHAALGVGGKPIFMVAIWLWILWVSMGIKCMVMVFDGMFLFFGHEMSYF